jgi:hypothetical protein
LIWSENGMAEGYQLIWSEQQTAGQQLIWSETVPDEGSR